MLFGGFCVTIFENYFMPSNKFILNFCIEAISK
jgi:hypothetical protein